MPRVDHSVGSLNRKIEILRNTGTRDDLGQVTENFTTLIFAWASYTAVSDWEKSQQGEENFSALFCRFLVRNSTTTATITAKDRVRYRGKVYNIIAPKEVDYNRRIELSCSVRDD